MQFVRKYDFSDTTFLLRIEKRYKLDTPSLYRFCFIIYYYIVF